MKKQKKAASENNLLPNIFTRGALQNIIETDLGSYSAGLLFSFFHHFRHPPDDPLDEP